MKYNTCKPFLKPIDKKLLSINSNTQYNNTYVKFSDFENNIKKLGIDVRELDQNFKKYTVGDTDDYIRTDVIKKNFAKIVDKEEEERKKEKENKKFLTEKEKLLRYSILRQGALKDDEPLYSAKIPKGSKLHKMHMYEKFRLTNYTQGIKKNKGFKTMSFRGFTGGNTGNFSEKNFSENDLKEFKNIWGTTALNTYSASFNSFFSSLNSLTLPEHKIQAQKRAERRAKDTISMREIVDLLVDMALEAGRIQEQKGTDLVNLDEYRKWMQYFIDGKSVLGKTEKIKNYLDNSVLREITGEEKEKVLESETEKSQFLDYVFYRGEWEMDKIINPTLFSCEVQIFQVLGEDDFISLIPEGRLKLQGFKLSQLPKLPNSDFELRENDMENVTFSGDRMRHQILAEFVMMSFERGGDELKLDENPIETNINPLLLIKDSSNIKGNISNRIGDLSPIKDEEQFTGDNSMIQNEFKNDNEDLLEISHIPIRLCFIGHSFSGRKTQAKILSQKYEKIKVYSIREIIQKYVDEYNRLQEPIENLPKFKSMKKAQIEQIEKERQESLNQNSEIFSLLSPILETQPTVKLTTKKTEVKEISIRKDQLLLIPDETKIHLISQSIKKDFPKPKDNIYDYEKRKKRMDELENLILEGSEKNQKGKTKASAKELAMWEDEKQKLFRDGFFGFILVDFPETYEQLVKLEKICSGFIQEIDKEPDNRESILNDLTLTLDKPYANIEAARNKFNFYMRSSFKLTHMKNKESSIIPLKEDNEIKINENISTKPLNEDNIKIGENNDKAKPSLQKLISSSSVFSSYVWLEVSEEEALRRAKNRFRDPMTGIIYHTEFFPPPEKDKKLNERLEPITEPTEEELKEEIRKFDLEFPKKVEFIEMFKNIKKVSKIQLEETTEEMEKIMQENIDSFVKLEAKDIVNNLDDEGMGEDEENKYYIKLVEVFKRISSEKAEILIKNWVKFNRNYSDDIKIFLYGINRMKSNILNQMSIIQTGFIEFLNSPSSKKNIVQFFKDKYETFIEKFRQLKNNNIVKEEFNRDILELSENFWELIQNRKFDAIVEMNKIKDSQFIEHQLEYFVTQISKIFILEAEKCINNLNSFQKFYRELKGGYFREDTFLIFDFNEKEILRGTENLSYFDKKIFFEISSVDRFGEKKEENNKTNWTKAKSQHYLINPGFSPKIDKIFKNCFRLLFLYDTKIANDEKKENEEMGKEDGNNVSRLSRRKMKKKGSSVEMSVASEGRLGELENERKVAIKREKERFKARALFLKLFGESMITEMFSIALRTFKKLDDWIIESIASQNKCMNSLITKLKYQVNMGIQRLNFDLEFDKFDIFKEEKYLFRTFEVLLLKDICKKEINVDIEELRKVYLDLKGYEIQKNYVKFGDVFDILIKKHMFDLKSNGLMFCFKNLPYHYIHNFLDKFIIKTPKGLELIRTSHLFIILSIINLYPPSYKEKEDMIFSVQNDLKFHCFLTKEDFFKVKLWFEEFILNSEGDKDNTYKLKNIKEKDLIICRDKWTTQKKQPLLNKLTYKNSKKSAKSIKDRNLNISNDDSKSKSITKQGRITEIKEFIFEIMKNYDDQINFIEFIDIATLKAFPNIRTLQNKEEEERIERELKLAKEKAEREERERKEREEREERERKEAEERNKKKAKSKKGKGKSGSKGKTKGDKKEKSAEKTETPRKEKEKKDKNDKNINIKEISPEKEDKKLNEKTKLSPLEIVPEIGEEGVDKKDMKPKIIFSYFDNFVQDYDTLIKHYYN